MSKVLVVEDEASIAELIEDCLSEDGVQTDSAHSGEEGLTAMFERHPDLVILDLRLPRMSGLDVCRQMHQDSRLLDIPVIVLTADASRSTRKSAYEAGADDFITKPFDLDELSQRVHIQLHHRECQRISELTGLPSGPAIVEAIEHCVNQSEQRYIIMYLNIEHLNVYNETYSFLEGNELIQATATILREVMSEAGGKDNFLGHIQGGEFVIITRPERAQTIIAAASTRFSQEVPKRFYPTSVCKQGYLMAKAEDDQTYQCPLAELSFDMLDDQVLA